MFASNWRGGFTSAQGPQGESKSYILTLTGGPPPTDPPVDPPPDPLPIPPTYKWVPMTVDYAIVDSRGLVVHPDDLVKMLNAGVAKPPDAGLA
jgi:hypothetical protein